MGHKSFVLASPVQLFQRIQVPSLLSTACIAGVCLQFLNSYLYKLNNSLLLPIILIKRIFQVSSVVDRLISHTPIESTTFPNAVELNIGYLVGIDIHVSMAVVRCLVLNLLLSALLFVSLVGVASRPFGF